MQRFLRALALSIIPFLAVGCEYVTFTPEDPAEWFEEDGPGGSSGAGGGGECAPIEPLRCGAMVGGDSSDPNSGHTTAIDSYPVAPGLFDGPEIAWEFVAEHSGEISWGLHDPTPTDVDHDLFLLAGDGPCRADQALARGPNSLDFEVTAGERYYLLIDGYQGDAGPFEAQLSCDGDGGAVDAPLGDPTPLQVGLVAAEVHRQGFRV